MLWLQQLVGLKFGQNQSRNFETALYCPGGIFNSSLCFRWFTTKITIPIYCHIASNSPSNSPMHLHDMSYNHVHLLRVWGRLSPLSNPWLATSSQWKKLKKARSAKVCGSEIMAVTWTSRRSQQTRPKLSLKAPGVHKTTSFTKPQDQDNYFKM